MKPAALLLPVGFLFVCTLLFAPQFMDFTIRTDLSKGYVKQSGARGQAIDAVANPTIKLTLGAWKHKIDACVTGSDQPKGLLTLTQSGLNDARAEMREEITKKPFGVSEEVLPKVLALAEQKCAERILSNLALTNPASLPPLLGEIQAVGYALPPDMARIAQRTPDSFVAVQL